VSKLRILGYSSAGLRGEKRTLTVSDDAGEIELQVDGSGHDIVISKADALTLGTCLVAWAENAPEGE